MTDPAVVLLAGGRSRRYPAGDKALVELGGQPMCRRAVAGLPGEELVVNCRKDQRPPLREALGGLNPRFAVDPVPDRGPLAGLLTALRLTTADRAIVVACDMPFFDRATARALDDTLDDAEAALVDVDGQRQPLGAAYRVASAREACETTLACGSKRLVDAVARLDIASVDADAHAVRNCNRPDEIDAAADALERPTPVQ
jgi:molybdopterin-guanine dinucleotide biosynthesis protein A